MGAESAVRSQDLHRLALTNSGLDHLAGRPISELITALKSVHADAVTRSDRARSSGSSVPHPAQVSEARANLANAESVLAEQLDAEAYRLRHATLMADINARAPLVSQIKALLRIA